MFYHIYHPVLGQKWDKLSHWVKLTNKMVDTVFDPTKDGNISMCVPRALSP